MDQEGRPLDPHWDLCRHEVDHSSSTSVYARVNLERMVVEQTLVHDEDAVCDDGDGARERHVREPTRHADVLGAVVGTAGIRPRGA